MVQRTTMKTLKDYKEKVLGEFKELEFVTGTTMDGDSLEVDYDMLESFLSLAIDNAVAEAFKAVEMERIEYKYSCSIEYAIGWNSSLQEVEDRKKQYLI